VAAELHPRAIAFVGKEAYRGAFGERPELGPQLRTLDDTGLYVLPSTSPANAAVPYAERLRWFRALREWLEPEQREAVRALVVDGRGRVLLLRWERAAGAWWIAPGGGLLPGESDEVGLRRELEEELGLREFEVGGLVVEYAHALPSNRRLLHQRNRIYLVRVDELEPAPTVDLAAEDIHGHRWWTLAELAATGERIAPPHLAELLRSL
jgi:8-oxo-dGTP pyrophosphatase MutT (NUDIX family)